MKFAAALPIILLSGSVTLAQTSKPAPGRFSGKTETTVIALPNQSGSCPVALRAQQGVDITRREVGDLHPSRDLVLKDGGQLIHLLMTNPDARHIVAANVTVRGLTEKKRLVETLTTDESSDAAKTMDVRFAPGTGKEISTSLRLPGFSAVQTVELNSVTYDDGSLWKVAAGNVCRSQVDPLMLVDMR
jgi:hypothetical protein